MSVVKVESFSGLRPAASEIRLAVNEAVQAENVTLRRGLLAPRVRQLVWTDTTDPYLPVDGADLPVSLFRFRRVSPAGEFWMYWESDVDVAPGPVANIGTGDQRHYYTGDGVPKLFTAASIDDATPPYGGSPDSKYPYSWFKLGVPAPTAAPEIDAAEYTPPDTGLSGEITSLAASSLTLRLDYWKKKKYTDNDNSGNTDIYEVDGIGAALVALTPGTRVVVESIVDANHVTVVSQSADQLFKIAAADYGFCWTSVAGRPIYDPSVQWNFYVPNSSTLAITAHGLVVGDVLRITSTPVPLQYDTTAVMTVSPHAAGAPNAVRTVTPTSGTIAFTGSANYVIERGGAVIDPGAVTAATVLTTTRSYVHTWVTHLGEESAPSPPSTPVIVVVGDSVGLHNFGTAPSDHIVIENIRIYRAATGSQGTEFQFVAEIAYSPTATYVDNVSDEELGELLPSETWDVPPSTLKGIIALPIGCAAGFYDNVMCFSEAGYGHAWPEDYQYAIDYTIVAAVPIQQIVVVLTEGNPYVFAGAHPRQMSNRRTEVRHPCLDKRGAVTDGASVIYPSPTGLVRIDARSAEVLTKDHYTKEVWAQVVGPELATNRSIRAWFFDDMYIMHATYTYDGTDYDSRLVFDLKTDQLQITSFTELIQAGFYDPAAGEFLFAPVLSDAETYPRIVGTLPASDYPLLRWDWQSPDVTPATEYVTGTWYSRTFPFPRPISPAAARAICRRLRVNGSYNAHALVRVKVYGVRYGVWSSTSNTLVDETSLVSSADLITGTPGSGGWTGEHRSEPFRVPTNSLFDAARIEITVEGPVEVEALSIAESMEELQDTP